MIKIENLNKYYSSNDVVSKGLENINIEFKKGEFVAIVGESGSGKSTLLNVVTFMDSYDDGEIYFNGEETSYFNEDDISEFKKKHVSFIFQNYNLMDSYTVLENVMLPLIIKGLTYKEAKEKATKLIEKVGLSHRIKNKGSHLSGGEKQRVSIARALASDAEILACDEATGNLDSENREQIVKLIKEVCKDKLVLYVTHNYDEIKDVCTRTIYLKDGHIIKDIVKDEVNEDNMLPVDFSYKSIKTESMFLIALKNVFSTPRKNLFIFFILFIMSMIFSLIINATVVSVSDDYMNNLSSSPIIDDNYCIYKKHDNLNILGEVTKNQALSRGNFSEFVNHNNFYYTPYDIECDQFYGERINETDEFKCNVYLPYFYKEDYGNDLKKISFVINDHKYNFEVVGFGYSNKVKNPLVNFNYEHNINLKKNLYSQTVNQNFYMSYNEGLSVGGYPLQDWKISNVKKPIVRAVKYEPEFRIYYNKKDITDMFEIEYYDNYLDQAGLNKYEFSFEFLDSLEEDSSFYTTSKFDFNKNIKELEKNNVLHYMPSLDREANEIMRLVMVLTVILLICPFILFFILTRLILKRVYSSKIKDYSIVRILGVNLGDMKKMVIIETYISTILSMILGHFTILLIANLIPQFRGTPVISFDFVSFSIFVIVVLIFAYLLSNSFSKLLYKDSSMKTLKEEVL